MISVTKKYVSPIRRNNALERKDIQILKQNNARLLTIQNVIATRIRKDNSSIYVDVPSREIKKWFETRRI